MGAHFKEPVSNVSERLKQALKLRHMTAAELSRLTNITTASLSHYINGRYIPKQDKIYQLSEALRVSPSWLMGLDVDIDGTENSYTLKENADVEYVVEHATDTKTPQQIIERTFELCKILETLIPGSEDMKLLKDFHALTPDSQALIKSMIVKLNMAQATKEDDTPLVVEEKAQPLEPLPNPFKKKNNQDEVSA